MPVAQHYMILRSCKEGPGDVVREIVFTSIASEMTHSRFEFECAESRPVAV